MLKHFKKILIIVIVGIIPLSNIAQSTFSLEILTIGVHPFGNPNLPLYENALDAKGNLSAEPGLTFSYETFVRDNWLSFQFSTSIFSDAAGQMAGFTDITFRMLFFHKWRSSFYIGAGPGLNYRNSWTRLTYGDITYSPEANYYVDGNWEILPTVIGKLEYDVFLGRKSDLSFGVYYGHSFKTFTLGLGYRYWISTKVKHTKPCHCGTDKYKKRFLGIF